MTLAIILHYLVLPILGASLLMAVARLVMGPTLADRIVALDFMSAAAMALVAIYAVESGEPVVLQVAIVLALISFLGTVAFAYFVARGQSDA
jgi:multicomponent Na+:H+ antiporter subunit F